MPTNVNTDLHQRCRDLQDDFMKVWEQLVNIDTGTGYGEGLVRVGSLVAEFLKTLGAEVRTVPASQPEEGFHVIGTFSGKGTGKVMTMAHMDTVFPAGTAKKRPFRIEGEWAYGPGVSDCKGSVVLCLYAMKLLREMNYTDYGKITCLFNCDEETGSPSSRELIKELAKEHDYVLCCEPGQVGDGVVLWRKGSAVMTLEAYGRSAHAGSAPQDGRNAMMELIRQITQLSQLGDEEKLTTLNFTTIQAGDRVNVIPDYAAAKADIRVVYPGELDRIEKEAQRIAKNTMIPDTTVKVTLNRNNPPFPQNEKTNALIAKANEIYGEIGKTLRTTGAGGASDANWAASAGAVVVDGLGPVKGGPNHTENERSNINSIVPRLYLLSRLFMELGNQQN